LGKEDLERRAHRKKYYLIKNKTNNVEKKIWGWGLAEEGGREGPFPGSNKGGMLHGNASPWGMAAVLDRNSDIAKKKKGKTGGCG